MLRIVINNQDVEYFNATDIGLSLSKRATDPANPFARLGSRSYTVKFPATNVNNAIFNDGNHTQTTNKFRSYTCAVYDGSTLLISGKFKLTSINRTEYSGFIVSDDVGFKDIIDGKSIQDLNLGEFRFVANKRDDEVEGVLLTDTWTPDFQYFEAMWFALISYGNYFQSGAFDRYAIIDELSFQDFTPNFSYTKIFRQIFEEAGYTVSGELVDDVNLQDLMFTFSGDKVPWNWELLTKVIIQNNQRFSTSDIPLGNFGGTGNPLIDNKRRYFIKDTIEVKDHLSKYNNTNVTGGSYPVGQEWLCPRSGTYEFQVTMITQQELNITGAGFNALQEAKHNKLALLDASDGSLDVDSDLFQDTKTPYFEGSGGGVSLGYEITNNIELKAGESKNIIYDTYQFGDATRYNPTTGVYTAGDNEGINITATLGGFGNRVEGVSVIPYVNGVIASIQPQGYTYQRLGRDYTPTIVEKDPFTYYNRSRDYDPISLSAVEALGFGAGTQNYSELTLQNGDELTIEITNTTATTQIIEAVDFSPLTITTTPIEPVPIFEISDTVKAYIEPWKGTGETAEEKTGGSVASNYDRVSVEFINDGYTPKTGGYEYNTSINYKFQITCQKGELLKWAMLTYNSDSAGTEYVCNSISDLRWNIVDGSGETFKIAGALPDISQIDYVSDALRLFNLYYTIDESNKTVSFMKRDNYFRSSNPLELPFSLHDRTFTQSKAPRTFKIGLRQLENDGYKDQLEGLRVLEANPYADKDSVFTFTSLIFGQAFPRLYSINSKPVNGAQFLIPTLSPENSTNIFRNDVDELRTNTPPRLVFRGDENKVYSQPIDGGSVVIDEKLYNDLPVSRVDDFVSFKDGDTIFGNFWNDRFLYQATDVLTIRVSMTAGQYNEIDLRRSVVIENNTYIVQEISGFNPLNPKNVTLKLLRL